MTSLARRLALGPASLALLAVLAGLAQAAALALPWSGQPQWWLQLLSLAVLVGLLDTSPHWHRAACLGWLFATAWLSGTFWWLFISMHTYGGLPAALAVVAVLGLAAFLGSYYAAASVLYRQFRPVSRSFAAIFFVALWLLAELARGTWLTGFPWGAGGYAHVDGPLAWLAPWVGVYGLGAVASLLAALPVLVFLRGGRRAPAWWACAALLVFLGAGGWAHAQRENTLGDSDIAGQRLSVALLQGNIPQDEKFQPGSGVPLALRWYAEQLMAAQADLVVAPETAIPLLPQQLMPVYLPSLEQRYAQGNQAALIGIPLGDAQLGYTNSVISMQPGPQPPYRYDKQHLVPFGEFIPRFFHWFTAMMNIPLGDFSRGRLRQPPFVWKGQRMAPNICYEDLFGEELGARFADPALAPTVFVNFSNIGWFGNTVAVDQHLHISRMRALEFRRPMVRATNTGTTVVIDHRGVVTHELPRFTRGVLVGEVQGRSEVTPYAVWVARWGLMPLWLCCALVLLLVLALRGRLIMTNLQPQDSVATQKTIKN